MHSETLGEARTDSIEFFRQNLLNWFRKNRRHYPWRDEKNPYRILIAEVMLQRTRADQVVAVYMSFIKKFPDIMSVAETKTEEISVFISQLGLFWKSGLIKDMAQTIATKYGGTVPSDRKELLKIPAIGDYIADALSVFAFNNRGIVIDSNVIRLVSRYYGIPIKGEMRRRKLFIQFCQSLLSGLSNAEVRDFNWALIDHPSIICRPMPQCHKCQLSEKCKYYLTRHKPCFRELR